MMYRSMKELRIQSRLNTVMKTVYKMEQEILALLRHPEATPEQIQIAREVLIDTKKRVDAFMQKAADKRVLIYRPTIR